MKNKMAWTSCETYGTRWFNLEKLETYPVLCRSTKCNHCMAYISVNKLWETMEYEIMKELECKRK